MATSSNIVRDNPLQQWDSALLRRLKDVRPSALATGELTVLLQVVALGAAVTTVEAGHWLDTPPLLPVVLLAVLTARFAAWLPRAARYHRLAAVLSGLLLVYLAGLTLVQAQGLGPRSAELHQRLKDWALAVVHRDATLDTMPLALLLTLFIWLAGYFGSWALFRHRNVWATLLPVGTGLVILLTYLPEQHFWLFYVYLLASLFLVAHVTILKRRSDLEGEGVQYPAWVQSLLLGQALVVAALALGLALVSPLTDSPPKPLKEAFRPVQETTQWLQEEFQRTFASVPQRKYLSLRFFGSVLPMVRPVPVSDEPILSSDSQYPLYWQARVYDQYTSTAWKVQETREQQVFGPAEYEASFQEDEAIFDLADVGYQVGLFVPSPYLLAAGKPLAVDAPAKREIAVSRQTREALLVPNGVDVLAIKPTDRLKPGSEYNVEADLMTSGEEALRSGSQSYPSPILERYLQLPDTLPSRVAQLAASLARDASNPYDKAVAIENYLRTYTYRAASSPLPFDADAVDHFLFETKEGYADYFASSMVVMLRSIDIPARLVLGFGPGQRNSEEAGFVVRDRDSHAWPEAFFPEHGWVEFEPTPIYPTRWRGHPEQALAAGNLIVTELGEGEPRPEELLQAEGEQSEGEGGGRLPGGLGLRPRPLTSFGQPLGLGGALFLGFFLLGILGWWLLWRRSYLLLHAPETAYERLRHLAGFLGIATARSQTPSELASRLAKVVPYVDADLRLIGDAYIRYRYGRTRPAGRENYQLRQAWERVRRALVTRLTASVRG